MLTARRRSKRQQTMRNRNDANTPFHSSPLRKSKRRVKPPPRLDDTDEEDKENASPSPSRPRADVVE